MCTRTSARHTRAPRFYARGSAAEIEKEREREGGWERDRDRAREEERQRKRERRRESEGQRARLVRNVRADASVSPPRVTGEYSFIKLRAREE